MLTTRKLLIADVSRLQQKLEKDISSKLTDDKKPTDRTPLEHHKAGILKEVIAKAKSIAKQYALNLMPEDETTLQNNTVYVEWDDDHNKLKYTFLHALGEGGDVKRHDDEITIDQLPELAAVRVPLELSSIEPLCINILKELSARKQLKFDSQDLGKKNKSQVLKDVLQVRDNEFSAWLYWMESDGLAPADQYKMLKIYFKKEFEKQEKQKENESSEDFETRVEKHFADEFKEIAKFERLYKAVFQFYYRLSRQMFCLQQFETIKNPEDAIAGANVLLGKLQGLVEKTSGCHIESLRKEHTLFESAFINLTKHMTEEPEAGVFGKVPVEYGALTDLVALFDIEVKRLQQSKARLADIRNKAQTAAKSGDRVALLQHKNEAKEQITVINSVKASLTREIQTYISLLHDQINNIELTRSHIEAELKPITSQIPDMVYLTQIATFIELKNEKDSEFERLDHHATELLDACKQHNGLVKENGWGALASAIVEEAKTMLAKLQQYAEMYLVQENTVDSAFSEFVKIVKWQKNIANLCQTIPVALTKASEKWDDIPAEMDARWRKPFEELVRNTKLNGFMVFMRRHWWKMLIVGIVLAAITAPVAFILLGSSFVVTAIAATVAFVIGVALGASMAKATDKCCLDQNEPPRRSSSADVMEATHGSEEDRAVIAMQDNPKLKNDKIVIDFSQVDAALDSASRTESTSTRSYNPFA